MKKQCEFCDTDLSNGCCNASYKGYVCTRERGHVGPHVACGFMEHAIITWRSNGFGGFEIMPQNTEDPGDTIVTLA